jgi:hypothetical protein
LGAGGREFESRRPDHPFLGQATTRRPIPQQNTFEASKYSLFHRHHIRRGSSMPARIYKPSRNAMQSGKGKSNDWMLEFEQSVKREADPLMGWNSAAETATQVKLSFATREEAEAYARKNGIAYQVSPESPARQTKKSYSDNFKYGRTTLWTH